MNAQRGGQRRSETAFLRCVSELCAHTNVCWKAHEPNPLGSQVRWGTGALRACPMWPFKGRETSFTQFVLILQQQEHLTLYKTVFSLFPSKRFISSGMCILNFLTFSYVHVPWVFNCHLVPAWVGWGYPALVLHEGGWVVFPKTRDDMWILLARSCLLGWTKQIHPLKKSIWKDRTLQEYIVISVSNLGCLSPVSKLYNIDVQRGRSRSIKLLLWFFTLILSLSASLLRSVVWKTACSSWAWRAFGVIKEGTGWSRAEGPDSHHLRPRKGVSLVLGGLSLASVAAVGLLIPSIYLNIFWIVAAPIVCDKGLDKRSIDQAVLAIHLCLPPQTASLRLQWHGKAAALRQAGTVSCARRGGRRCDSSERRLAGPSCFLTTPTCQSLCECGAVCGRVGQLALLRIQSRWWIYSRVLV